MEGWATLAGMRGAWMPAGDSAYTHTEVLTAHDVIPAPRLRGPRAMLLLGQPSAPAEPGQGAAGMLGAAAASRQPGQSQGLPAYMGQELPCL